MIKEKIDAFTQNICEYNNFTYDQTEEIKYSVKIITLEVIKLFIVISLFSVFGYFKEISILIFVMSLTKPFTGGYHENTQSRCLVATIILSLIIITLYKNNDLNLISIILLNLINIFSVYHQAPIINKDMPLTRADLINKNRLLAIINCFIFFIISIILYEYKIYSNIITWTLFINSCLMFNAKHKN